jgi:hypothetical protein
MLPAFFRGGSSNPPVRADTQIDGDCNAHDKQAAEAKDDEPPDHPHNGARISNSQTHALRRSRQNAQFTTSKFLLRT